MLAGLAGLDPVLPGELQGGLDRFRAAGEEIELVELARERGGELPGELLHRAVGERGGRDVAELARLARQRLRDLRIRVAENRDVGAAHGVEVALPLLVVQPAARTTHDARVAAAELAVEDVAIGIAVVRHSSPLPLPRRPGSAESYAAACISARERRSFVHLHRQWVRTCPSCRVYFLPLPSSSPARHSPSPNSSRLTTTSLSMGYRRCPWPSLLLCDHNARSRQPPFDT